MNFSKADFFSPAFVKTGNNTASVKAGTVVDSFTFSADTPISMPTLTAGTDYGIWVDTSGNPVAGSYSTPPSAGAVRIGGFHYAPGGNATDVDTGGNTTPQISQYSFWDLKFRPACPDPRGMVCVNGKFWADIYLLAADHTNGTSRNAVTIANKDSKPLRPLAFGGNGTATMPMDWWGAQEVFASHGKRLPSYEEACAAFFGAREGLARGNQPFTTGLGTTNTGSTTTDEKFTSKWGVIQAVGCQWVWGREMMLGMFDGIYNGTTSTATVTPNFYAITGGRGHIIQDNIRGTRGALLGGKWNNMTQNGSRALDWADAVNETSVTISARGFADHFCQL